MEAVYLISVSTRQRCVKKFRARSPNSGGNVNAGLESFAKYDSFVSDATCSGCFPVISVYMMVPTAQMSTPYEE